jgi:hypothetical protein
VVTDLQERYGPRTANRKVVVAVIVVLAAAGLSWLIWVMLAHGRPAAQSNLVSWEAEGEHSAQARFTVVRREPDVEASCLLRALAADHAIVGEIHVAVGPGEPTVTTLGRTIRTEREATAVQMVGCVTDEQQRRR